MRRRLAVVLLMVLQGQPHFGGFGVLGGARKPETARRRVAPRFFWTSERCSFRPVSPSNFGF